MKIPKKLLVLVDGSKRSLQTVNYLNEFMPKDEQTHIVLFHVFYGLPEGYRQMVNHFACAEEVKQSIQRKMEDRSQIMAYMEQAKQMLISGGFLESSIEIKLPLMDKGVARDIIEEAKKGYDAVVLRRRGFGALKSVILGSVAVKLLQSLTFIPIIIVGQVPAVKNILLAVDASPSSNKAVDFVATWLGGYEYRICIFHAILGLGALHFEGPDEGLNPDSAKVDDSCIQAFKTEVVQLFQSIKDKLIANGFGSKSISEKIVTGAYSRSTEIVKMAEAGSYGTIVVGRRGLSQVEAFFMGRVGHKVIYGGKNFTVWVV